MKKKMFIFLLAAMMCFSLTACGEEYEDTNGADDFSLQTITDENIIKRDIGASGLSYSEEELGAGLESSEYYSDNFNGVEQIYLNTYFGKSDVTVYIGTMSVEKGNFKMAVILNDEIIKEIPLDTFNEIFYFEDISGDFSIVVAGESADFEFSINVY